MTSSDVEDVTKGLRHLVGRSLLLKGVNFLLGSLLLQTIPLDYYGIHTVNLFFFVTVTGWARGECFRKVLLRLPPSKTTSGIANRNVQRISFRATCVITLVALLIWLSKKPTLILRSEPSVWRAYHWSVTLHALAALLTAVAEGPILAMNYHGQYEARARQENVSAIAYTVCYTVPMLIAIGAGYSSCLPILTVLLSGGSQLIWSISMLALGRRCLQTSEFLAAATIGLTAMEVEETNNLLTPEAREMLKTEVVSCVQKLILSESDKLLLMRYVSDGSKGAIAMSSNLGGILIRLFFAPQEEMLSVYYSVNHLREEKTLPRGPDTLQEYMGVFRLVGGMQIGLGLNVMILGPALAECILCLAYGARGILLAPLFSQYCLVVTLMSFVGIMEGFLNSVSPCEGIRENQRFNLYVWLCVLAGVLFRMELLGVRDSPLRDWQIWIWAVGLTFAGRMARPIALMRRLCSAAGVRPIHLSRIFTSAQFHALLSFAIGSRLILAVAPHRVTALDRLFATLPTDRFRAPDLAYAGGIGVAGLWLLRRTTRQRPVEDLKSC